MMSHPTLARELFCAYFPVVLRDAIQWDSLALCKETFLDEDMKESATDVLYSTKLIAGGAAYLYMLCENEGRIKQDLPIRFLEIQCQIYRMHLKQHPNTPLPIVYPILIYSGVPKWNAPLGLGEMYGEHHALAHALAHERCLFIDVIRIPDPVMRQQQWAGLMTFVMKHRKMRDFAAFMEAVLSQLNKLEGTNTLGRELGRTVLYYIVETTGFDNRERFTELCRTYLSENLKGDIMTIAESWVQDGMQKGMQKGMQQKETEIAKNLLNSGFDPVLVSKNTGLDLATVEKLKEETKH